MNIPVRLQDKDSFMAWDSLMDFQGTQSQKEGQDAFRQLRGGSSSLYLSLVLLAFLLALGSLETHQLSQAIKLLPFL